MILGYWLNPDEVRPSCTYVCLRTYEYIYKFFEKNPWISNCIQESLKTSVLCFTVTILKDNMNIQDVLSFSIVDAAARLFDSTIGITNPNVVSERDLLFQELLTHFNAVEITYR